MTFKVAWILHCPKENIQEPKSLTNKQSVFHVPDKPFTPKPDHLSLQNNFLSSPKITAHIPWKANNCSCWRQQMLEKCCVPKKQSIISLCGPATRTRALFISPHMLLDMLSISCIVDFTSFTPTHFPLPRSCHFVDIILQCYHSPNSSHSEWTRFSISLPCRTLNPNGHSRPAVF